MPSKEGLLDAKVMVCFFRRWTGKVESRFDKVNVLVMCVRVAGIQVTSSMLVKATCNAPGQS